jgi:hypothetical protein
MAEVLRSFDEPIRDDSGDYHARVVGRLADDGRWEGWLEFVPLGGAGRKTYVSPVESRQPEREHLVYWASGLTPVYAEGALGRARRPVVVRTRVVEIAESDAPAPRAPAAPRRPGVPAPVLVPFDVGSKSLDILAQELGALGRGRLLNIIAAYELNPGAADVQRLSDPHLVSFIVSAVQAALASRPR